MLFGRLDPEIFTVFGGPNRHLYEAVIMGVYDAFFRADLLFPTQTEVVHLIYSRLAARPELWREDEAPVTFDQVSGRKGRRLRRRKQESADPMATAEAMVRARHIYDRLRRCGWLEESRYGLRITVDMPAPAMRLTEFLCSLKEGVSEQLGGLVAQIKAVLETVSAQPKDNALGLNKSARDAAAFGRYLRSVLSALREVDRQVLESGSIEQRLAHYFQDFVERVLLRDYAAITTTSHPYRFRHKILATLQAIQDSPVAVSTLAAAYLEAGLAQDLDGAREMVGDDLEQVRRVFDQIEEAFRAIQQQRGRLEARLRNTVRYAGRRSGAFLDRSGALLLRLDRRVAANPGWTQTLGLLETPVAPFSPALLARTRAARAPVSAGVLLLKVPDPVDVLRRQLERAYLDRLAVRPAQVARFLERRVAPYASVPASRLLIADVNDFLAFEALRLMVSGRVEPAQDDPLMARLAPDFAFEAGGAETVDNAWLACGGFVVRRKTDRVTLEALRAG